MTLLFHCSGRSSDRLFSRPAPAANTHAILSFRREWPGFFACPERSRGVHAAFASRATEWRNLFDVKGEHPLAFFALDACHKSLSLLPRHLVDRPIHPKVPHIQINSARQNLR